MESEEIEDNIKVVIRIRPLTKAEQEAGYTVITQVNVNCSIVSILKPNGNEDNLKSFHFDTVFDMQTTQKDMFERVALPVVDNALEGFNGTIMAYGQTGTGKTWTMEGNPDIPDQGGIIPNVFLHIFNIVSLAELNTKYLIQVNFIEIYNEELRDLLSKNTCRKLTMKDHPNGGIYIEGHENYFVSSLSEMYHLLDVGKKNRATGATKMNEFSSRSHAIFTVSIFKEQTNEEGETRMATGKLYLVDLAGSERQYKSQNEGARLKESIKINQSLTTLGLVISALTEGKIKHIRYRDSKLTRLLQDSLGGNSKTTMIATIGPADYNYKETICTLGYATRTKKVRNRIVINEKLGVTEHMRLLQEEVISLRTQLAKMMKTEGDIMSDEEERSMAEQALKVEQEETKKWHQECEQYKLELQASRAEIARLRALHKKIQNMEGKFESQPNNTMEKQDILERVKAGRKCLQTYQAINDERIQAELKLKIHLSNRETDLKLIEENYSCLKRFKEGRDMCKKLFEDKFIQKHVFDLMTVNPVAAVQQLLNNERKMENLINEKYHNSYIVDSTTLSRNLSTDGTSSSCKIDESISQIKQYSDSACQLPNNEIWCGDTKKLQRPSDMTMAIQNTALAMQVEHKPSNRDILCLDHNSFELDDCDGAGDSQIKHTNLIPGKYFGDSRKCCSDTDTKGNGLQTSGWFDKAIGSCDQIKEVFYDTSGCRFVRYRHANIIKYESDEEEYPMHDDNFQDSCRDEVNSVEITSHDEDWTVDAHSTGGNSDNCFSDRGMKNDIIQNDKVNIIENDLDHFWTEENGDNDLTWKMSKRGKCPVTSNTAEDILDRICYKDNYVSRHDNYVSNRREIDGRSHKYYLPQVTV